MSLTDFVSRFGLSPQRLKILNGFLDYRAQLHDVGLTNGFQWLDGSFLENVEFIHSRPPNDVDVVTFYHRPQGQSQLDVQKRNPALFPNGKDTHDILKATYRVDAYLSDLDTPADVLVQQSVYWYSVWSHRRDYLWKGYVQVDLSPVDDVSARALVNTLTAQGGQP